MTSASTIASTVTVTVLADHRLRRNSRANVVRRLALVGRGRGGPSAGGRRPLGRRCATSSLTAPRRRDAGHQQADLLAWRVRRDDRDDPAAVHDRDPVGERHDLVQFAGDQQHGGAVVALVHDPAVDELDRADVHAAGRLRGDEQLQRPGHLAGHDRPSAGCRRTACRPARRGDGVRMSNCSIRSPRRRGDRVQVERATRCRTAPGRTGRAPGSRRR